MTAVDVTGQEMRDRLATSKYEKHWFMVEKRGRVCRTGHFLVLDGRKAVLQCV